MADGPTWDKDAKGDIRTVPLRLWAVGFAGHEWCVLRLEYERRPGELGTARKALQLRLPVDESRRLGQALIENADYAESLKPPPKGEQN